MRLIVKEKYKQLHLSPQYGGISVIHISARIGRIRTITISDASESDKNENNE